MSFVMCCGDEHREQLVLPQVLVEYTRRVVQTNKLEQKTVKYETGKIDPTYAGWKRLKYKSKDKRMLLKAYSNGGFVDIEFPHTNSSISEEEIEHFIEWRRIGNIIEMPLYATAQTCRNFQKITINNKLLKEALQFIQRTHPHKFKQLLSYEISEEGLYEYKLYRNGIIQNVIIDDYVPVVNSQFPFGTGPAQQRQIFPMLIEKAIAKICQGYDKIPTDLNELLQILFCGPLRKTRINELSDKVAVAQTIEKTFSCKGVGGFLSKKQPKIRTFGINENQLYHLVDYHKVIIDQKQELILYELVSDKRLAAWNGKFSHNDSQWDRVSTVERNKIFKNLKNNKSFCISSNDIVRIFDHLLVFDGTEVFNKDWLQNISQCEYPSFNQFQVQEEDHIFIKACTTQPIRTALILARYNGIDDIEYIKGAFHENSESIEFSVTVQPGRYIVCLYHDWILSKNGPYNVFISSMVHTSIVRAPENAYPGFLQIMFKNHSQKMRKEKQHPINFNWHKYYSVCMLAEETGFAYLYLQLKDSTKKKITIKIDQKALRADKWQLMEPQADRKEVELEKGVTDDVIFIVKTHRYLKHQKIFFPATAFIIKD